MTADGDPLQLIQAHADELLALERSTVRRATGPLERALAEIHRWLGSAWITAFGSYAADVLAPTALAGLTAELTARLARVAVRVADVLRQAARRALSMGVRHALAEADSAIEPPHVAMPHTVHHTIATAEQRAGTYLHDAQQQAGAVRSWDDANRVMGRAGQAVTSVERSAGDAVHRASAAGAVAAAEQLSADKLWVAERDACLHCLAYSGEHVAPAATFPDNLTFGQKPSPLSVAMAGPPMHPNCRCHLTPWLGNMQPIGATPGVRQIGAADMPDALKREARRSVVKGWALPTESNKARLEAAQDLLAAGADLPRTVEQRARARVARARKTGARFAEPVPHIPPTKGTTP